MGSLFAKDYSQKSVFPTSLVAIDRALYIGLTLDDRDILFNAKEYLLSFLEGKGHEYIRITNERMRPWLKATLCTALDKIDPYSPECDETFHQWVYIAHRAFEDGEYNYERDASAQHELFATREKRLLPIELALLTNRRDQLPNGLEDAMLHYYGEMASKEGYFWKECPGYHSEQFVNKYTRRCSHSFDYINQFTNSAIYLKDAIEWVWNNQRTDGLFDYGPQVKDPWGYFRNFSTTRGDLTSRITDCTMEILLFTNEYLKRNPEEV